MRSHDILRLARLMASIVESSECKFRWVCTAAPDAATRPPPGFDVSLILVPNRKHLSTRQPHGLHWVCNAARALITESHSGAGSVTSSHCPARGQNGTPVSHAHAADPANYSIRTNATTRQGSYRSHSVADNKTWKPMSIILGLGTQGEAHSCPRWPGFGAGNTCLDLVRHKLTARGLDIRQPLLAEKDSRSSPAPRFDIMLSHSRTPSATGRR